MVGNGHGREAEDRGGGDQLLGMAGAVEEAEVAVGVELAVVVGCAHRPSIIERMFYSGKTED